MVTTQTYSIIRRLRNWTWKTGMELLLLTGVLHIQVVPDFPKGFKSTGMSLAFKYTLSASGP
jgi:hypothetical protein